MLTRRSSLFLSLLAILPSSSLAQSARSATVAITRVTLIDGRDSVPRRDQTVIVSGRRIVDVGPASTVSLPRGATIVDGRGKYMIPGLWDMHVHADVPAGRQVLALYVANGVTGIRDMAGRWETLRVWRDSIAAGRIVGPRIVASGPYLVGGDTPIPHLLARDTAEARRAVDSLARLGVAFVKVHTRLRPEVLFAITRRARQLGLAVAGHVSAAIGAQAASDSGVRSIEHLLGVPLPCTPAESAALVPRFPTQAALGRCSSRDLAPVYSTLARNGTWVTPTFTGILEVASWPRRDLPGDSVARFLPDTLRRFVAGIFPMPDSIPPGADAVGLRVFRMRLAQAGAMHRAGVGILTGTDAPLRNSPPGFGLHQELQLLVQGGMSTFAVLRAATLAPARYFAMTDSLGTIERGKLADLVLLDADPLVDIRNTARIAAVFADGRYIGAAARRLLLAGGGSHD